MNPCPWLCSGQVPRPWIRSFSYPLNNPESSIRSSARFSGLCSVQRSIGSQWKNCSHRHRRSRTSTFPWYKNRLCCSPGSRLHLLDLCCRPWWYDGRLVCNRLRCCFLQKRGCSCTVFAPHNQEPEVRRDPWQKAFPLLMSICCCLHSPDHKPQDFVPSNSGPGR